MLKLWIAGSCLGLFALVQCIPVEIVYRGDACECPRKLNYEINIPKPPKPQPYEFSDYGYKIDVPTKARAKVSYSFDFIVEEPKTPKPEKETKYNLYAKVDRITMNKGDCKTYYGERPPKPSHPPSCSCYKCGNSKPQYRYVYDRVKPCGCKQPQCKCQSPGPVDAPYGVYADASLQRRSPVGVGNHIVRRKRDLRRALFQKRKFQRNLDERPARFVKKYHTHLEGDKAGFFGLQSFIEPTQQFPSKRKTKKVHGETFTYFPRRKVKRDIKGEYDLLERDREEMDLTLPEIIQFMPETLQPNFKRGPYCMSCRQCQKHRSDNKSDSKTNTELQDDDERAQRQIGIVAEKNQDNEDIKNTKTPTEEADTQDMGDDNEADVNVTVNIQEDAKNSISTSVYTKRNAAAYQRPIPLKSAASIVPAAAPSASTQLYNKQNAYRAQSTVPYIPAKPIESAVPLPPPPPPPPAEYQNAYLAPQVSPPIHYLYDHLGHKYAEQNGHLRLVAASSSVPDPMQKDAMPLKYAGDLALPQIDTVTYTGDNPAVGAHISDDRYPIQHVSNDELDRIISDIIHRHPGFIEATSHYGGSLVDPEPLQEQQTKDFLKKLIDGRLRLWFNDDEDPYQYSPFHITSYPDIYPPLPPPMTLPDLY